MFIKNESNIYLFVIAIIANIAMPTHAYEPAYWHSSSVLNSGKWVKIRVDSTGMQQITHSKLIEMGFKSPEDVTVWGYSGAMLNDDRFRNDIPDNLPQTPAIHHSGKIIFFGENNINIRLNNSNKPEHSINPYSASGYYFLTDSRQQLEPEKLPPPAGNNKAKPDFHKEITVTEPELANPFETGIAWFDTPFSSQRMRASYTFELPRLISGEDIQIIYSWAKDSGKEQSLSLSTLPELKLEGTTISTLPNTLRLSWHTDTAIANGGLTDNKLQLHFDIVPPMEDIFTAIDWIRIAYTAANNLGNSPQMLMHLTEAETTAGAISATLPPEAMVWDITTPAQAYVCTPGTENTFALKTGANKPLKLVAFNPEAELYTPVCEGCVPEQNLHAMPVPDMLIISAPGLIEQARELAGIHRSMQNMETEVVSTTQIYNEYSSGSPSAYALRRIIKHFHDTGNGKLRYVLLYGTGSYNNRHASATNMASTVPTYQCHNKNYIADSQHSYCTDAYFVMLNDDYSADNAHKTHPTLPIGRIPAINADQAATYNAKVRRFLSDNSAAQCFGTALVACDLGDNGEHSRRADAFAKEFSSRYAPSVVHKVYSDMYPISAIVNDSPTARKSVTEQLMQGTGLFTYIGHGNPDELVSAKGGCWLSSNHLLACKNRMPYLALLCTCNAACFDQNETPISSDLLFHNSGGAIAVIANTRSARSSYNSSFSGHLAQSYAALEPGDKYGDLWLRAISGTMENYANSSSGSINTIKYLLIGDPAVNIPVPDYEIDIHPEKTEISPLQKFSITGRITQRGTGTTVSRFNGTATVSIYADSATSRLLGRVEPDFKGIPITQNSLLLYKGAATASDGIFSHDACMPTNAFTDTSTTARIIVYALSDSESETYHGKNASASGVSPSILLSNAIPPENTFSQAVIKNFYAECDPSGSLDPVPPCSRLTACIDAQGTGLNMSENTLNKTCTLAIDSQTMPDATITPQNDGIWILDYTLPGLPDGRHTATLTITDNTGSSAQSTIGFIVKSNEASALLETKSAIARSHIEFTISHNLPDATGIRLLITDTNGNTVHSRQLAGTDSNAEWDLAGQDGETVAPGPYKAFIQVTDRRLFCSSNIAAFVVLP